MSKRCHGIVIDQDGGEKECKHLQEWFCMECNGHFCDYHYDEDFNLCLGCTDKEVSIADFYQ